MRKIFQSIFILLVFTACLSEREPLPPLNTPKTIAGLNMSKVKMGRPALKVLYSLHGRSVEIINGYVASYSDGENEVTVYYSEARDNESADKLIERMVEKIEDGNKFFTDLKSKNLGSFPLYSVTGMGQEHYFFENGKRIVWIAGDNAVIERALSDCLVFLAKEKMKKK